MSSTYSVHDLNLALKHFFGYEKFLHSQLSVVQNVLSGNDVLVIMPTGGGKSICYQLPALLKDGIAIVVSPLISLMKDQVDTLNANDILFNIISCILSNPFVFEIFFNFFIATYIIKCCQ
mgnify:CR=1 FL=1